MKKSKKSSTSKKSKVDGEKVASKWVSSLKENLKYANFHHVVSLFADLVFLRISIF